MTILKTKPNSTSKVMRGELPKMKELTINKHRRKLKGNASETRTTLILNRQTV
jgi:hypothetical protein